MIYEEKNSRPWGRTSNESAEFRAGLKKTSYRKLLNEEADLALESDSADNEKLLEVISMFPPYLSGFDAWFSVLLWDDALSLRAPGSAEETLQIAFSTSANTGRTHLSLFCPSVGCRYDDEDDEDTPTDGIPLDGEIDSEQWRAVRTCGELTADEKFLEKLREVLSGFAEKRREFREKLFQIKSEIFAREDAHAAHSETRRRRRMVADAFAPGNERDWVLLLRCPGDGEVEFLGTRWRLAEKNGSVHFKTITGKDAADYVPARVSDIEPVSGEEAAK